MSMFCLSSPVFLLLSVFSCLPSSVCSFLTLVLYFCPFETPGKEMNFIDLFKTLGLDMSEVAEALGMDTVTLNRMDHDSLLQLLTQ